MPPKFALQNVLDVHHSRVEALEVELGRLLAFKLEAEKILEAMQNTKVELMHKLEEAQTGEIDLFAISVLRSNILVMDKRIEKAIAELTRLAEEVHQKQKELLAARQDEEVLQILKRKGIESYNAELASQEAHTQDDIYIAQAFRQRQEGNNQ
jgi:flagellar export protein FliJ